MGSRVVVPQVPHSRTTAHCRSDRVIVGREPLTFSGSLLRFSAVCIRAHFCAVLSWGLPLPGPWFAGAFFNGILFRVRLASNVVSLQVLGSVSRSISALFNTIANNNDNNVQVRGSILVPPFNFLSAECGSPFPAVGGSCRDCCVGLLRPAKQCGQQR